jgi:manganese/zinc/iron transport system substrate-binding protein
MRLRLIYLSWLFLLVGLAACTTPGVQASDDLSTRPIQAVATTGMVADLVQRVGGERVQVEAMMGAGIDPHLFKPSERDVISLAGADVIFYNGLHLEAGMASVFERMGDRIHTVAVTDGIDRTQLSAPPEFAGNYDPHVWFDVQMWMQGVKTVQAALSEMDPAHASVYQANAESYLVELEALDQYVSTQAQRIPDEKRVLITAHDAFNYFGRAYGFEVRGLQGISTASEAGTGDVQALADYIAEKRIPAIFVESSVSPRTIQAVQAAVRARGFDVQIGGQLFSDAMGNPGTPEGTYPGMVRHNIDTIVHGLAGDQ